MVVVVETGGGSTAAVDPQATRRTDNVSATITPLAALNAFRTLLAIPKVTASTCCDLLKAQAESKRGKGKYNGESNCDSVEVSFHDS